MKSHGGMYNASAGRVKKISPPANPLKVGTKGPNNVTSKVGNVKR